LTKNLSNYDPINIIKNNKKTRPMRQQGQESFTVLNDCFDPMKNKELKKFGIKDLKYRYFPVVLGVRKQRFPARGMT
jgi:hypothetical protein